MSTREEITVLRSNINTYLCLLLIGAFTLACGLILWHAFYGTNPIVSILLSSSVADYNSY
ncbi:MAG TPA: hypothetical protein VN665_02260 [Candidatus Paceibacterota bacterium]|nr:hypothetical protein [Candidatus Paceibacterota bacterium]